MRRSDRIALAALIGVAGILLPACQSDAREAPRAVVQDSSGVEIVLNLGPITEVLSGWTLTAEPILSIGSVEGDEALQFFGIAGAHRLSDGRIGVVNVGLAEALVTLVLRHLQVAPSFEHMPFESEFS